MTDHISIEIHKDLAGQYSAYAKSRGRKEGESIFALVLADAKRYSSTNQSVEAHKKESLLKNSGYRYSIQHALYFNQESKIAISIEFVEQRSFACIRDAITLCPRHGWRFFFIGGEPSGDISEWLIRSLENINRRYRNA